MRIFWCVLFLLTSALSTQCNMALADLDSCDATLANSVKITSAAPPFTSANSKEVMDFTVDVANSIYAEFDFPKGLEVEIYESTEPFFSPLTNSIRTPFDFATTLLKPNEKRIARYWTRHSPRFRAKGIYVHELGHSFQFKAFIAAIPEYREFYALESQFLKQHPHFINFLKSGQLDLDRLSHFSQTTGPIQELSAQINSRSLFAPMLLVKPYDELLSDLAEALYLDDPQAFLKDDRLLLKTEEGRLLVFLFGWAYKPSPYRLFNTEYQTNSVHDIVSIHNLLGPSRSYIWQLYLKNKGQVLKSRFMKLVFNSIIDEIKERIASKRFIDFSILIEGRVTLQSVDSEEFNDSLIARLKQIQWNE